MSARLAMIEERRRLLALEVRAQRMQLAAVAAAWRSPLALADALLAAANALRRHPLLGAALMALVLRRARGRPRAWAGAAFALREGWRRLHRSRP